MPNTLFFAAFQMWEFTAFWGHIIVNCVVWAFGVSVGQDLQTDEMINKRLTGYENT